MHLSLGVFAKAANPINVTEAGMLMLVRLVQSWKAPALMSVMVGGSVMQVRAKL